MSEERKEYMPPTAEVVGGFPRLLMGLVREELKSQGMSVAELARRLEMPRSNLYVLLERGNPSMTTLYRLLHAVGINPYFEARGDEGAGMVAAMKGLGRRGTGEN